MFLSECVANYEENHQKELCKCLFPSNIVTGSHNCSRQDKEITSFLKNRKQTSRICSMLLWKPDPDPAHWKLKLYNGIKEILILIFFFFNCFSQSQPTLWEFNTK